MQMAAPPDVGDEVAVRFRPRANDAEVQAVGTVVWRSAGFRGRGGVIGVQFARVEDVPALLAYVEHVA